MTQNVMTPEELRDRAAQPTYENIRRDRVQASGKVAEWLACLEDHLFDRELNVHFLKRSTGTRDNSMAILFHASLGVTPKEYITECRMAVARRLLVEGGLKMWQISQLLGFSSLGVFSKSFLHHEGIRPSLYKQGAESWSRHGGEPQLNLRQVSEKYLKRVLEGRVALEEGQRLIALLQAVYSKGASSTTA